MANLRCPQCRRDDSLQRVEAAMVYPNLYSHRNRAWEYTGGLEIDWNSQSRELAKGTVTYEFRCTACGEYFDCPGAHQYKPRPRRSNKGESHGSHKENNTIGRR